jgi:hypothetical protein
VGSDNLAGEGLIMVDIEDVRSVTADLPRAYEAIVRDRVKFRVGRIVFAALSRDETTIGFGFPREERAALVESDPVRYFMPSASDMRYQWVCARMAELDPELLRDHLIEAWTMCVPKSVAAAYLE